MSGPSPGPAPKPSYFKDPATDALYQMVLVLAEEVAALREVVDTSHSLQAQGKTPTAENLATHEPDEHYDKERAAFVQRLMAPVEELMRNET